MSSIRIQLLVCVCVMESNNVCVLGCMRIWVFSYMGGCLCTRVYVQVSICMRVCVTWYACTRAARGLEVPFHTAVPRYARALDRNGRVDHVLVVLQGGRGG